MSKLREVWPNTDMTPTDLHPWPLVEQKIERARQYLGPQIKEERSWLSKQGSKCQLKTA